MEESQIVIRVDRDHLRQFRAACILRGTTPTKELARLLVQQLAEWEQETSIRMQDGKHII